MPLYRCTRVYLTRDDAEKLGELLAKLATRLAQIGLKRLEPSGGVDSEVRMEAADLRVRGGYVENGWPEERDELVDISYIEVCSDKKSFEELAAMLNELLSEK